MVEYVRALHPNPEQDGMADDIPDEKVPGCGDTVLLEYDEAPPVEEGDVFRDSCPSCKRHDARLEVVEIRAE
ncbi:hypothetical protein [Halostella salina]|uniref:hypothetical protein n=1 Tax=Halostella salina TaxID=1547897 RepID=UPI000EF79837|nr:hypothetical protein [Halostella salina]